MKTPHDLSQRKSANAEKNPSRYVKRLLQVLIAIIMLSASSRADAQQVQVNLQLPPPGILDPEQLTELISFNNTGTAPLYVQMYATIEEEEKGLVFSGVSGIFELQAGFSVPHYTDYEPVEVEYSDAELEQYVMQTNNMPGGDYVICISLIDAEMGEEVGYNCIPHSVFHPSAPQLVYPPDGSSVQEPSPVFTWLSPTPIPPVEVFYAIRLVEVFPGQLPYEAIQSNPSFFVDFEVMASTYPYPADAAPMEEGQQYAWQVQALMADGLPVGENHGYSEVQVFQYSTSIVDGEMLTWVSPQDGYEISEPNPSFQWHDPMFADGLPPAGHYYTLQLTPLTAEVITDDTVLITLPLLFTNISEPKFTYPYHLPPLTPGAYSAQVHRIQQEGYLAFFDVATLVTPLITLAATGEEEWAVDLPEVIYDDFLPPDAAITASTPAIQFSMGVLPIACDSVLREFANRIEHIGAQIDSARQECCESRDERDRLQAERDRVQQQRRGLPGRRAELDGQKNEEQAKIQQMENELKDLIDSAIFSDVVGSTPDHGNNYIGLGGNVRIYFSGSETSINIVKWFLREYRDDWQRLRDGIRASQQVNDRLDLEIRGIDGDLAQLDRDIANLDAGINNLAAAINACNDRVNKLLAERDALRDEMADKHRECEKLIRRYLDEQDELAKGEESLRASRSAANASRERTEPAGNAHADNLQREADRGVRAAEKALNEAKRQYEALRDMDNVADIKKGLDEIRKKLEEARKAAAEAADNATKAGAWIECAPNGKREEEVETQYFRIWDNSRKIEITKLTGEKIMDFSIEGAIKSILEIILEALGAGLPFSIELGTAKYALYVHIPVNECQVKCVRSRICKNGRWVKEDPQKTIQCRPIVITEFVVGLGEYEGGAAWSIEKHRDQFIHGRQEMDDYCK